MSLHLHLRQPAAYDFLWVLARQIPFMDESMAVVSKPSGMLVHRFSCHSTQCSTLYKMIPTKKTVCVTCQIFRSRESGDRVFLLQTLRNQLGKQIFFVNRLDRAVSGLMIATFDSQTAAAAQVGRRPRPSRANYHTCPPRNINSCYRLRRRAWQWRMLPKHILQLSAAKQPWECLKARGCSRTRTRKM